MSQKTWKKYQVAKQKLEKTQTELQEANKKLAESLEELDIKNKELQKAMKARDLFFACVSHDLRNPLNVLLGNIEVLSTRTKDVQDEAQILNRCKLCGEALLRQINNLLDVSKMNANKFELNPTQVNMVSFFEKFWSYAKIGLERKHLGGYLAIDKNIPKVLKIDHHRLHQILDNLMSNATKFTDKGSVRITFGWISGNYELDSSSFLEETLFDVEQQDSLERFEEVGEDKLSRLPKGRIRTNSMTELEDRLCFKLNNSFQEVLERTLSSSTEDQTNYLRIEIVDTGCGISQEAQTKLFQPFVQADSTVSSIYGGTGLGLYIVKNIVEKMRGTIKLNSMKGVGTRFQLILKI